MQLYVMLVFSVVCYLTLLISVIGFLLMSEKLFHHRHEFIFSRDKDTHISSYLQIFVLLFAIIMFNNIIAAMFCAE